MEGILIAVIRIYQTILSPFTAGNCRFYPSCSQYAIDAISKYGPLKGTLISLKRVGKCHPLHPGGYDPA
jgi:putative membrane protein insertion efficiency factor